MESGKTPFDEFPLTNWFPGHMHKAGKQMDEALKLVDLVVELVDARAPLYTRNPEWEGRLGQRPFMILGNKADLADNATCRAWQNWFHAQGITARFVESTSVSQVRRLPEMWKKIAMDARAARGATRPLMRPVRIMISGVPNVGKSTLVNHLIDRKKAIVGAKPGVTRQTQWIPLGDGSVELLDTPGILWPFLQNKCHELLLALLNIMNEELIPPQLLTEYLLWMITRRKLVLDWKKLGWAAAEPPGHGGELLEAFAQRRLFLKKGGELDLERAAWSFLRDFRDGRYGRFSLETPPQEIAKSGNAS